MIRDDEIKSLQQELNNFKRQNESLEEKNVELKDLQAQLRRTTLYRDN